MAQTIKLKRSATTGKVPSTSNLALGELAVNTYDGRIFFKKNDGSDSIEHIVTTDSVTTGSITIVGTTQTTTLTTTNRIDKQYLDDEVLNTSLNSFTQSAITVTGNGTSDLMPVFSGTHTVINSKIETGDTSTTLRHSNNGNTIFTISGSNGELLTVTDSNSGNLLEVNDSSGIDVFTVAANGDVSASGAVTASGITGLTSLSVGGTTTTNNLTISSLSNQASEATALVINGSNVVGTRELGSNAFNSTSFLSTVDISSDTNLAGGAGLTLTGDTMAVDYSTNSDNVVAGASSGTPAGTSTILFADTGGVNKIALSSLNISLLNNDSNYITSADGGNADTVDSLHASSFIRSDANDTATGNLTFSGTIDASIITADTMSISAHLSLDDNDEIRLGSGNDFVIEDDGTNTLFKSTRHGGEVYFQNENASGTNQNTLILGTDTGNTSATYVELRYNNVERIKTTTNGSDMAGIVNFNGTTQSTNKTTGTVIIDGGVGIAKTLNVGEDVVAYASSDERYKDNVTPIENPNEKLKQIGGYTFDWNDNHEVFKGQHDVGVIAQEIEKVLPEIVETRESGYKAVKYEKIVALLIESNKELLKRIEDLESKIK